MNRLNLLALHLIAAIGVELFVTGCQISDQSTTGSLPAQSQNTQIHFGAITEIYKKQKRHQEPFDREAGPPVAGQTAGDIEQIGIEHTPCLGSCPAYTAIIHRDGVIQFVSHRRLTLKDLETGGDIAEADHFQNGRVSATQFAAIAQYGRKIRFAQFPDTFSDGGADGSGILIMISNGSLTKVVSDRGGAPLELWVLEQLIDKAIIDGGVTFEPRP